MKLFNAQSTKKHNKNTQASAVNKALDTKMLVSKDALISVAGGINDIVAIWPPVKPK